MDTMLEAAATILKGAAIGLLAVFGVGVLFVFACGIFAGIERLRDRS